MSNMLWLAELSISLSNSNTAVLEKTIHCDVTWIWQFSVKCNNPVDTREVTNIIVDLYLFS